jgi:hypothetical protein
MRLTKKFVTTFLNVFQGLSFKLGTLIFTFLLCSLSQAQQSTGRIKASTYDPNRNSFW